MIRKLLLPLFLLLTAGTSANASHVLGMEIWYEYTGTGNVYRVYLDEYIDCATSSTSYQSIDFHSASAGQSFSRLFYPQVPFDTSSVVYCPGTITGCNTPYPVFKTAHFSDTVTLGAAGDWKISSSNGSRSAAILNLQNPSGQDVYVEAFLNNAAGPNTCARMVAPGQAFTPVNTISSQPFQIIDVDGDSVAANMMVPQTAGGISIPYGFNYSFMAPMGSGSFTQLSVANSVLKSYCTSLGRYSLAARAYDYRNGQMVGYSSRDWVLLPTTYNPKAPVPVAGTSFTRTTCPGQPTSYTFNFIDSVATDSVFLQLTPPANGISYTISYTNGVGAASATISFTTPAGWNVAANPYFIIRLAARDHACPISGNSDYDIVVHSVQCNSDTVWAGDADANYIVNMYDPLAVALAYNATGPVRSSASIAWTGQWCANWAGTFNGTGVNYKHADCDGNGTVNSSDLAAISANYSLVHSRQAYAASAAKETGLPDLYFDHTGVNTVPGITLSIPIKFGSTAQPVSNIYGLAARIRVAGITPGNLAVSYPATWLGTGGNTLRFSKSTASNTIDWAYARTDHQNISGAGALGALGFSIPASAAVGDRIVITMEDVKVINANSAVITNYNVLSDTIVVKALGIGNTAAAISHALVVPNPSQRNAVVAVGLSMPALVAVTVTDITGRLVWATTPAMLGVGQHQIALPQQLRSGVYFVRLSTDAGGETLKWIAE